MKYYKAIVKLGHMGSKKYAETVLYIEDNDMISAMVRAQSFPGVKHSIIPEVFEITKDEYLSGLEEKKYSKTMKSIELKTM